MLFQAFTDIHGWMSCTGGWHELPSGDYICHVNILANQSYRSTYCQQMGGEQIIRN